MIGLALAACASQPIAPDKAVQYKRVGLLSAMGDQFEKTLIGVTVFGNDYSTERLDLGADRLLTKNAVRELSTRYDVVDLSRYRGPFLDAWSEPSNRTSQMVPEVVRRLMGAEGLDAYILITPRGAPVRGTRLGIGGIGIAKREGLFGTMGTWFHLAYDIRVVDGTDYALVAEMPALPVGETELSVLAPFHAPVGAPFVHAWSDLWAQPSMHQTEIMAMLDQLAERSLPETLRRAALID